MSLWPSGFLRTAKAILRSATAVLTIFCCREGAQAQLLFFKHFDRSNGLAGSEVLAIVQDDDGFIWAGTSSGLCRFDGREFVSYRHNANDSASLCGDRVTRIVKDNDGMLWIGTNGGGACRFDPRTGRFARVQGLFSRIVYALAVDATGAVWIGCDKSGIGAVPHRSLRFERRAVEKILPITSVFALMAASDSAMCMGPVGQGLVRAYAKASEHLADTAGVSFPYPAHTLNCLLEDDHGGVWAGAWDNALHHFDLRTGRMAHFPLDGSTTLNYSGNEVLSLAKDDAGHLWCGTLSSGLVLFDPASHRFSVPTMNAEHSAPRGQRVNCIFRDRDGRMWLGTNEGISLFDPMLNRFATEVLPDPPPDGPAQVYDLLDAHDGRLLIAASDGLYTRDGEGPVSHRTIIYNNAPVQVTSLLADNGRTCFLGTNKTLLRFDAISGTSAPVPGFQPMPSFDFYNIEASRINTMVAYVSGGTHWMLAEAYGHAALWIDRDRSRVVYIDIGKDERYENLVRRFRVDRSGTVWALGASQGIMRLEEPAPFDSITAFWARQHLLAPYAPNPGYHWIPTTNFTFAPDGRTLCDADARDLLENDDGTFWLTTASGLYRFDPRSREHPFDQVDVGETQLDGIARDSLGMLWIIAGGGLVRYDPAQGIVQRFGANDGLPTSALSGAIHAMDDGLLYAGTKGAYVRWKPERFAQRTSAPRIFITHLNVFDKTADTLLKSADVRLAHDRNFLFFQSATLNFTDPEKDTYEYFLEGLDEQWHSNGNNTAFSYTALPPGDYTLRVRANNAQGPWRTNEATFHFIIVPAWYDTWWFACAVMVLITALLYALYRYRVGQLLKMQAVRNRIASDLHDEVGSSLSSITIGSQLAAQLSTEENQQVKQLMARIGETSNESLRSMSDIVWAIDPKNDQGEALVKRMRRIATELLEGKGIEVSFSVSGGVEDLKLPMNARKEIVLIYKEAVHNASKYSGASLVQVSLHRRNGSLNMSVKDDGAGFDPELHPDGHGLGSMKRRADALHGELVLTSAPGMGTLVGIEVDITRIRD